MGLRPVDQQLGIVALDDGRRGPRRERPLELLQRLDFRGGRGAARQKKDRDDCYKGFQTFTLTFSLLL
jgi:hypothetical protein